MKEPPLSIGGSGLPATAGICPDHDKYDIIFIIIMIVMMMTMMTMMTGRRIEERVSPALRRDSPAPAGPTQPAPQPDDHCGGDHRGGVDNHCGGGGNHCGGGDHCGGVDGNISRSLWWW